MRGSRSSAQSERDRQRRKDYDVLSVSWFEESSVSILAQFRFTIRRFAQNESVEILLFSTLDYPEPPPPTGRGINRRRALAGSPSGMAGNRPMKWRS
jgi:hypothetical protein